MSDPDRPSSKALRTAYDRGYTAGRRASGPTPQQRRDQFWRETFLAALPAFLADSSWRRGSTPMTSLAQRVELAREVADEALAKLPPL